MIKLELNAQVCCYCCLITMHEGYDESGYFVIDVGNILICAQDLFSYSCH